MHHSARDLPRVEQSESEGLSYAEFVQVLANFKKVYAPKVKSLGYTLVLKNMWDDSTVNSVTTVVGNKWVIYAYGGLARYKGMTVDGYMIVLGHELGHHIGGYPKYPDSWATNESESDYAATLKVFRILAEEGALLEQPNPDKVDNFAKLKCNLYYQNAFEENVCERAMMGALVLATVLADLNVESAPSFYTPDTRIARTIMHEHAPAQIRLDTMVAGAVCLADPHVELSTIDPAQGACMDGEGARPRSWFVAPKNHFDGITAFGN